MEVRPIMTTSKKKRVFRNMLLATALVSVLTVGVLATFAFATTDSAPNYDRIQEEIQDSRVQLVDSDQLRANSLDAIGERVTIAEGIEVFQMNSDSEISVMNIDDEFLARAHSESLDMDIFISRRDRQ